MASTILCVDDDRNLCEILASALGGEGHTVLTAFDGDQALQQLTEGSIDLVFMDLILPRRDGFAVLDAMRAMESPVRDTAAVIISGCSPTPQSRDRAQSLGVLEMITKPVPLEELFAIVSRSLGERKERAPVEPEGGDTAPAGLSGTLERMPFPALLHHLHGLRATGVLHLATDRKRKWIEFRDGYPLSVRSNLVNECLGNFLVRDGKITQAALAESARRMRPGRRQGEVLVAMEILSEDEMVTSLRAQADEKLLEIFSWPGGRYQFEFAGRLQRANSLGVVKSPADLILRGVRERFPIQRVEQHLRSHADCFVAHCESPFYRFQEVELEPAQQLLLSGLDGRVRLVDLLRSTPDLERTLYALVAVGLLELRSTAASRSPAQRPQPSPPRKPIEDDERRARLTSLAERLRSQNHFEVLGLDAEAPTEQIHACYERIAATVHPDRYNQSSQAVQQIAESVFAQLTIAYETLLDPRRRGEYELDQRKEKREAAKLEESQRALEAEKEFQRGEAWLAQRSYEEALGCFGKALELYPGEGEYHAHYGWALHLCHPGEASIAEEAMEHVLRGIKLAGHREKSYLFMGRLYKAIGRPRTAEKMFTRAVQIQPESVEALRELRLISMRRDRSKGLIGRLFGR